MATNTHKTTYKIALLCDDSLDKPDGVQQYVVTLGEWLRSQGHDVHYITSTTARTDLPNMHVVGRNISVRFNSNRLHIPLPVSKRAAARLLRDQQFDVLHIQMPHSPLLAGKFIRAAGAQTAVIGTFHIYPESRLVAWATKLLGLWVRRQLRRFDKIISVSAAAQTFAKQAFRIDTEVVPNVVDVQRFLRATSDEQHDVIRIVFLGRLVKRKGADALLRAVAYMKAHRLTDKQYTVIIGGKGPMQAELAAFVQTHDLESTVQFAGFVAEEDKVAFLAQADIAVFPSTGGESFGISLVEAMAAVAGGVVLGGDNPGYRTVLTHDEQLLDPRDTEQFATKLAYYINHDQQRRAAVQWQQTAAEQYDTPTVGATILQLYDYALRSRRG